MPLLNDAETQTKNDQGFKHPFTQKRTLPGRTSYDQPSTDKALLNTRFTDYVSAGLKHLVGTLNAGYLSLEPTQAQHASI